MDHVFSSRKWHCSSFQTLDRRGVCIGSDHHMVRHVLRAISTSSLETHQSLDLTMKYCEWPTKGGDVEIERAGRESRWPSLIRAEANQEIDSGFQAFHSCPPFALLLMTFDEAVVGVVYLLKLTTFLISMEIVIRGR
ncbi:unnamed protein product [Soboliphyme baturini]|uniref:Uncharacterized protein n=1 Tax=Soboliphyme baturini TaxID=241478 RepID=A0A183IQW2_9BILA|nr:unnamed protein product [Soboliphyme baturini]